MNADKLLSLLIDAHKRMDTSPIRLSKNVSIYPQTNYSGKMAKRAYIGKREWQRIRAPYAGILDFKIVQNGKDTKHKDDMILPASTELDIEVVRRIHKGGDPLDIEGLTDYQYDAACCIQAAFLEQEINWGQQDFQLWSYFGNKSINDNILKNSSPRDLLMLFMEACNKMYNDGDEWYDIEKSIIKPYKTYSKVTNSTVIMPPISDKKIKHPFTDYTPYRINNKPSSSWVDNHIHDIKSLCVELGPNPW